MRIQRNFQVMSKTNRGLFGAMVMAALWLVCAGPSDAAPEQGERVLIKDFMFSPMALTTKVGEEVTWVNQDDEPHTVVSDTGLFRSGALDTGNSYTFKFDKPGTYHVYCSMHPQMTATIVVE
jgi:plastocyanin